MGFTTSVLDGYTLSAVCACKQVIEKSKATNQAKRGVDYALSCPDVIAKRVATLNKDFGVSNVFQIPEIIESIKITKIEKISMY